MRPLLCTQLLRGGVDRADERTIGVRSARGVVARGRCVSKTREWFERAARLKSFGCAGTGTERPVEPITAVVHGRAA
jgi:hypothetical protein